MRLTFRAANSRPRTGIIVTSRPRPCNTQGAAACIDSAARSSSISRISSIPIPRRSPSPEAKRHVLQCCEATIERLARDPHYFAKPSQSLFQEIRHLFSISNQARVYGTIDCHIATAVTYILEEIERNGEGMRVCKATTRKGKPCQRTPLPNRDYCPSHQHLEERPPPPRRRSASREV